MKQFLSSATGCGAAKRYEPTPEEIRQRTAEIRAEWSEAERYRRAGMRPVDWSVPRCRLAGFITEPPE